MGELSGEMSYPKWEGEFSGGVNRLINFLNSTRQLLENHFHYYDFIHSDSVASIAEFECRIIVIVIVIVNRTIYIYVYQRIVVFIIKVGSKSSRSGVERAYKYYRLKESLDSLLLIIR